nr:polysaccharide export protein [Bacteroidota bacterium]
MVNFFTVLKYFLPGFFMIAAFTSCLNTRKVAYFNDVSDSTRIPSGAGLEPVIQKKDILSIAVSSLSSEATVIFNMPNLPMNPSATTNTNYQTAGYLVGED